MIHTTIGIYANGDFKINGVSEDHLESHIEYNQKYRPGRALVVDGKIEYCGYLKESEILHILKKNNLENLKLEKSTVPYV